MNAERPLSRRPIAQKYRVKFVFIEAVQWRGDFSEMQIFAGGRVRLEIPTESVTRFRKKRLLLRRGNNRAAGWVWVPLGEWVAHWYGDPTNFWPITNDDLKRYYEKDEDQ